MEKPSSAERDFERDARLWCCVALALLCATVSSAVWVSSSLSTYYYVCHFYLIRTDSYQATACIPSCVWIKGISTCCCFLLLFFSFERLLWIWSITAVMTVLVCLSWKNKDQLWFFSTCRDSFLSQFLLTPSSLSKKQSQMWFVIVKSSCAAAVMQTIKGQGSLNSTFPH